VFVPRPRGLARRHPYPVDGKPGRSASFKVPGGDNAAGFDIYTELRYNGKLIDGCPQGSRQHSQVK